VFIATLVAKDRLSVGDISLAQDQLSGAGCDGMTSRWIATEKAADLHFSGDATAARAALEGQLGEIDVIIQAEAHRHRKLLVADMDSTMITVECIDELADYAGIKAEISEITERAMRGELDFEEALSHRVGLLAGLPETVIAECLADRVKLMPGGKELVEAIHNNGGKAVLVSGGFTHFAEPVGKLLGFDRVVANVLGIRDGKLDGTVARPIIGAARKQVELEAALVDNHWDKSVSLAVGDGANDIPMIKAAGLGVAYHAKPKTEAAAASAIRYGNLEAIAYAISGT
jgi:phosphoserine phosphatase